MNIDVGIAALDHFYEVIDRFPSQRPHQILVSNDSRGQDAAELALFCWTSKKSDDRRAFLSFFARMDVRRGNVFNIFDG